MLGVSLIVGPTIRAYDYERAAKMLDIAASLEVIALIGLVVVLRRRLGAEIDRAGVAHDMLLAQNDRLREQNAELEANAHTAEEQAAELEVQAVELEASNHDLKESEAEQRRLVEEAQLLNRRLNEAQHVARLAYWEIDSKTGEVYWSDEMYRLAGLDVGIQPPPTDRYMEAVHPEDRQKMQEIAVAAARDLSEFNEQYRIVSRDGPTRTVQAQGRVLLDKGGNRKFVGTVQDISERVHLETQLRRSQKMEAIGQLAGGVAHDFNNVLTVIEGYTALLLSEQPADDDRASIEEIRGAGRRAASLTRQLLAFSRQQVLQPSLVSVNDVVDGVETMLRRLIGEHIEFHTSLARGLDSVKADPGQLEQVLMNLVVNARDAMSNGGVLTVETANVVLDDAYARQHPTVRPGAYVMLATSDTGVGIPSGDLDRIFEPFFTTKEAGKGTGLGLSTVHGIMTQFNGHVSVYSEVGRGTTFRVYLPRAESVGDATEQTAAPTVASRTGTEAILLVEDDAAVRAIAAAILRHEGYSIVEANNGLDAIRLCQDENTRFDLIISDMVMPGLGGRGVAEHVQKTRPDVPILLMSGYTRDAAIHSAELGPESLFIEKPFTPEALMQKVRDALDGAQRKARA